MAHPHPLIEAVAGVSASIARTWPFDASHYPALKGASDEVVQAFAIQHMMLHIVKEAGLLARVQEREEHGNLDLLVEEQVPSRARLAMKIIVSGFRLLSASGGEPVDLVAYMTKGKVKVRK